ncbi:MAG: DoxX family protein [Aeromonadaceae bacterium]|nr:DoxX family protein [Aeromonadaceae bacterium]
MLEKLILCIQMLILWLSRIPDGVIALLARFSIAGIFWRSGQTKVEGFSLDIMAAEFQLGWPRLSASVVDLFRYEYQLPWVSPELAALMAAIAEHLFPALILIGLATRFSALALLGMTLVIQVLVYPDAYPTHGVWAVALLFLASRGPGPLALDHLIASLCGRR